MERQIVAALIVVASAATSASAFADSGHGYPDVTRNSRVVASASVAAPAPATEQIGNTVSRGKTREQVQQELVQAYHDGLLPTSKHDYPPSEATIARNKELHQLIEPKWAAQH
uniref:DUF4148 domain-containing protein n=1 Tax=Burkholderia cepacia TaxID=292 RepID=UPI00234BE924|nr:DUF4148 domain-containing protein [Burkholderia cepacia]MDC6099558.1 DUF4148 domain-containing protein [Burkholderia cepacia]